MIPLTLPKLNAEQIEVLQERGLDPAAPETWPKRPLRIASAERLQFYSPDQPRDDHGRWEGGGGWDGHIGGGKEWLVSHMDVQHHGLAGGHTKEHWVTPHGPVTHEGMDKATLSHDELLKLHKDAHEQQAESQSHRHEPEGQTIPPVPPVTSTSREGTFAYRPGEEPRGGTSQDLSAAAAKDAQNLYNAEQLASTLDPQYPFGVGRIFQGVAGSQGERDAQAYANLALAEFGGKAAEGADVTIHFASDGGTFAGERPAGQAGTWRWDDPKFQPKVSYTTVAPGPVDITNQGVDDLLKHQEIVLNTTAMMHSEWVVLHELAHVISRLQTAAPGRPDGYVGHGQSFRDIYLKMLDARLPAFGKAMRPLLSHAVTMSEAVGARPLGALVMGDVMTGGKLLERCYVLAPKVEAAEAWETEERNAKGEWSSGGGDDLWRQNEPPFKQGGDYDKYRDAARAWRESTRKALALGKTTEPEAETRGYRSSEGAVRHNREGDYIKEDEWQPLPHDLYHVTTNTDAVTAEGLKTRDELAQSRGLGLGGGQGNAISFTTDPALAEEIRQGIVEMHDVAAGKITANEIWQRALDGSDAPRPYAVDLVHQYGAPQDWKVGDPLPQGLQAVLDGMELKHSGTLTRPDGEGWTPINPSGRLAALWTRPADQAQRREDAVDMMKNAAAYRENAGGRLDPLFFLSDTEKLASIDPAQIQVLHFQPIPGAMGYQMGSLAEWRTSTGAAVKLVGVAKLAEQRMWFYSDEEERNAKGEWTSGGDSATSAPSFRDICRPLSREEMKVTREYDHTVGWETPSGVRVTFAEPDKLNAQKMNDVLRIANNLKAQYGRPLSVSVTNTKVANMFGTHGWGFSRVGSGHVVLAPRALAVHSGTFAKSAAAGWLMPSSKTHDVTEYVLAHETGHTLDHQSRSGASQQALTYYDQPGSEYGKSSPAEAFAEAFAEYHLTQGRTGDQMAQDLAQAEGWRASQPQPQDVPRDSAGHVIAAAEPHPGMLIIEDFLGTATEIPMPTDLPPEFRSFVDDTVQAAEERLVFWDESQHPRGEGGRFVDSGGLGAATSSQYMDSTGKQADPAWRQASSEYHHAYLDTPLGTPHWNHSDVNPQVITSAEEYFKDKVAQDLATRSGLSYERANELVACWAGSSSDMNVDSVALQNAVGEKFGVNNAYMLGQQETFRNVGRTFGMTTDELLHGAPLPDATTVPPVSWPTDDPRGRLTYDERLGDARKFVDAMYSRTQEYLKGLGITEVTLARGENYTEGGFGHSDQLPDALQAEIDHYEGDKGVDNARFDAELALNPASSWSTASVTALGFAGSASKQSGIPGQTAVEYGATFPVERILSTPMTGIGCMNENEFVVVGGGDAGQTSVYLRW